MCVLLSDKNTGKCNIETSDVIIKGCFSANTFFDTYTCIFAKYDVCFLVNKCLLLKKHKSIVETIFTIFTHNT